MQKYNMTNAISGNKRAMEDILGLPPKALKRPRGFSQPTVLAKAKRLARLPSPQELEGKSFNDLMQMLKPKYANFVAKVVKGVSGATAVIEAGWTGCNPKSAASKARYLLHEHPIVMAAINAARNEAADEAKYNLKDSFDELKKAMEFAEKSDNATAYVRAVELRAKLFGLLVERQDVRNLSALSINIQGLD